MTKTPMTKDGHEVLNQELNSLIKNDREAVKREIAEAREHGDLKENAEYHAAKEEQGFCEGRIQDIEGRLCNAQVIDVTKIPNSGKVIFGATVTLLNIDTEVEVSYKIVGDDEADFKTGRISLNSPIARGLIGKEVDTEIEINTPGGLVEYEIVAVEHI